MSEKIKRVGFHTLGCKVNQHDTAHMAGLFEEAGWQRVPFDEEADAYVINTCTVTHVSDRKSRQMIRRAAKQNPMACVAVCGCYAQTGSKALKAIPEVDLILGTNERSRIVDAVEDFLKDGKKQSYMADEEALARFEPVHWARSSDRTRAEIKIQEGCDQFCSYCIIPYARGPLRSRPTEDTIAEINHLVEQGYKELVLTGIHIGAFGKGLYDEPGSLEALCRRILEETSLPRLRLSSIEVTEVSDGLVELMASTPRMMPHLHLPLQAGSDRTLKRMNRPYTKEDYRKRVREIRGQLLKVAITTDLMVGFPGETEEDFKESMIFANDMAFADMHIFKYSMRSGTPAAKMSDQIDPKIKDRRAKQIQDVACKNRERFAEFFIGDEVEVLIEEGDSQGAMLGHSPHYLNVRVEEDAKVGELVQVRLESYNKGILSGRIQEGGL